MSNYPSSSAYISAGMAYQSAEQKRQKQEMRVRRLFNACFRQLNRPSSVVVFEEKSKKRSLQFVVDIAGSPSPETIKGVIKKFRYLDWKITHVADSAGGPQYFELIAPANWLGKLLGSQFFIRTTPRKKKRVRRTRR